MRATVFAETYLNIKSGCTQHTFQPCTAGTICKRVTQPGWRRDRPLHTETQSMSLTWSMVWILPQDHNLYLYKIHKCLQTCRTIKSHKYTHNLFSHCSMAKFVMVRYTIFVFSTSKFRNHTQNNRHVL